MMMALFSLVIIFVCASLLANFIAPYSFTQIDLYARKAPPLYMGKTGLHLLGTDEMGRDIFSRLLYATRTSLLIAFTGAVISMCIGVSLGLLSGLKQGLINTLVRIGIDFQASLPFMIIALSVLAFLGGSLTLFILLLGLCGWEKHARLTSSMTMAELEKPYVLALKRNGAGSWRIAMHHVLPNILHIALVTFTMVFPEIMLLESSLSFLGLGLQPPTVSLGTMAGMGRDYLMSEWWISVVPGLAIFALSAAVSLCGDALRDRFDPSINQSRG